MSTIMSRMIGSSSTTRILSGFKVAFVCIFLFAHFRGWNLRQVEGEGRAFARNAAFHPEFAAHRLDIAARDIETKPGAAHRRCQRARQAHKLLKDLFAFLFLHAFPLV